MNRISFNLGSVLFVHFLTGMALLALAPLAHTQQAAAGDPVITVDFSSPAMNPAHWVLVLHPDSSGHFHSDRGVTPSNESQLMDVADVDRDVRLSPDFATHAFEVARRHKWFHQDCESHLKVAFQGWKKISYSGAEGQGSCTFNFSKDKEIAELGDAFVGVAETVREGARLELLLQHDPLGLDQETEYIVDAQKDGRLRQIGVIRDILERLAGDPAVMDRVRKRARALLARAGA
jgi:hypothetical protein